MKAKLMKKPQFGIGVFIVGFLLLLSLVAAVSSFLYLNNLAKYDKEYIRLAGDQRILIELMTRNALLSLNGDFPAYQGLTRHYLQFKKNMKQIKEGNSEIGLPPSPDAVSDRILSLDEKWAEAEKSVTIVIDSEAIVRNYANFARNFQTILNDVQQGSQQLTIQLVSSSAPAVQVHLASQMELLLTRLSFNTNRFLLDAKTTQDVAKQMSSDFQQFNKILNAMLEGDAEMNIPKVSQGSTQAKLTEIRDDAEPLNDMLKTAIDGINFLTQAQGALSKLIDQTDLMLDSATSLRTAYTQLAETRLIRDYTGLVLGAVALLCIIWLAYRIQQETKLRLQQTAAQNQRNQDAIMRLLDEICDLANGDLTTQATVTEDITGAIADAINYTVEQLRTLVSSINEITVQVSSAAKTTQATALHLAEASDQQANQISAASDAINQMATSIDNVSGNANESSNVANQSMTIAKKGASAVQDTIRGMDTIREQIQETSKRIKRLGESSQEIGDMVELINDIADQTNILALNAAIQAAMAGKSGRGFAVVADEVQRLAEKSTDATLQIENLVRTIQSDTNEAVASMEQSISQVVSGAKLALNAGDALSEIENVSTHLAELTQSISKAAQQQAKVSARISESMNVIQNVTVQTAAGTSNTSNSIGALADLSNTLRKSVSGFKLPAN